MFVLSKVTKQGVEIGIAGGQLEKGETAHIAVGKSITLVDAATGVTYEIVLLSVGASPDLMFDSGGTGSTTPGSTPAATTPGSTPATTMPSSAPAATTPSTTPAAITPEPSK
jgi:hypothetical protein